MYANEPAVGRPHEDAASRASSRWVNLRAPALAFTLALAAWASPAAAVCAPTSATIDFGSVSLSGAAAAATTIGYTCDRRTRGNSATLAISTSRSMVSGQAQLQFELYRDAAHLQVFPGAPAFVIPVTAPGATGSVTVYGYLLPPPQLVGSGTYTGSLTVTITSSGGRISTAPLTVRATVPWTSCMIQPATLAFGAYDPLSPAPRDATGTITIACNGIAIYQVGLGPGNGPPGSTRLMSRSGGGQLQYELYTDQARSTVWNTTSTVNGLVFLNPAPVQLPVFGRIPAGQVAPAGTYGDVVQSTINF